MCSTRSRSIKYVTWKNLFTVIFVVFGSVFSTFLPYIYQNAKCRFSYPPAMLYIIVNADWLRQGPIGGPGGEEDTVEY